VKLGLLLQAERIHEFAVFMLVSSVLLVAFVGLIINLSFSGSGVQPDWSFSILLAMLLSKRKTWIWVLPSIGIHDLFLYWSATVMVPTFILVATVLFYSDKRLGLGQQQRWACLFICTFPLIHSGMALLNVLLTLTVTVCLWAFFSAQREKVYVEPT